MTVSPECIDFSNFWFRASTVDEDVERFDKISLTMVCSRCIGCANAGDTCNAVVCFKHGMPKAMAIGNLYEVPTIGIVGIDK